LVLVGGTGAVIASVSLVVNARREISPGPDGATGGVK